MQKLMTYFRTLLICLAVSAAGSPAIGGRHSWRTVVIADLPRDDQSLWAKYHAGAVPGEASVNNACFKGGVIFEAQIRNTAKGIEERIIYHANRKIHHVFGPLIVISPFVIWRSPPGLTVDISSGRSYKLAGESLVVEKMESVAYQYVCHKGLTSIIKTAE